MSGSVAKNAAAAAAWARTLQNHYRRTAATQHSTTQRARASVSGPWAATVQKHTEYTHARATGALSMQSRSFSAAAAPRR